VGDKSQRNSKRFRVHLSVRYEVAREFVVEYAQNLSSGGLFIRGTTDLKPLERVPVQIELPGFSKFLITAEVAHILTPEMAATTGNAPGVGLSIIKTPTGFDEALSSYLMRLGKRPDYCVLVADNECRRLVTDAGYKTDAVPAATDLLGMIARTTTPILAVVVSRAQEEEYKTVATQAGDPGLVFVIDYLEEMDDLLGRLDDAI